MSRDEDLACAPRPGQAGVPVEFYLHPGAPHESGFIAVNTTAARRAITDRVLSSTGCPCPSPVAAAQPGPESVSTRRVNIRQVGSFTLWNTGRAA